MAIEGSERFWKGCVAAAAALFAVGCAEGIDPPEPTEVVAIAGGSFTMGVASGDSCDEFETVDRRPLMPTEPRVETARARHEVTVQPFCIDKFEVTNAQYRHCVAREDCGYPESTNAGNRGRDGFVAQYYGEEDGFDAFPVLGVAYEDAVAYCNFRGGYLPTEAQWEYVASSLGQRASVWADADLDRAVRTDCATAGERRGDVAFGGCSNGVAPAGASPADETAQGVRDMAGNAAEWVADDFDYFAYCAAEQPGGALDAVFELDGRRPSIDPSAAWAPMADADPPPLVVDGQGYGGSGFDGACHSTFSGCIELCGDAYGVDADDDEQRLRWKGLRCGADQGLADSVVDLLRTGGRMEDGSVSGCDAECARIWDDCVAGATPVPPNDGADCLKTCQEDIDGCLVAASAPGVSTACIQFVDNANCVPVPWCVPRSGHAAESVHIRPSAFTGELAGTKTVRGGHFQSARGCEAMPSWRDYELVSSPLVGFRCAFDPGEGRCPAQ